MVQPPVFDRSNEVNIWEIGKAIQPVVERALFVVQEVLDGGRAEDCDFGCSVDVFES